MHFVLSTDDLLTEKGYWKAPKPCAEQRMCTSRSNTHTAPRARSGFAIARQLRRRTGETVVVERVGAAVGRGEHPMLSCARARPGPEGAALLELDCTLVTRPLSPSSALHLGAPSG
jgi:hypothetical protein